MRKFLWMVAVGALVLAVAAPVMAVDFKFGAEYRVRFYAYANQGGTATGAFNNVVPGTSPNDSGNRGVQLRVRPIFDVSDDNGNIQARLRLEIGDIEFGGGGGAGGNTQFGDTPGASGVTGGLATTRVGNGAGGALGADGVNVETKSAYVDFLLPFGIPGRVRAGIQPWYLPKGLILDDDAAGVNIYGGIKPVNYELWWFRAKSAAPAAGTTASSTNLDNNLDWYAAKIDVAWADFINTGVYYLYGDNRINTGVTGRVRDNHFVGLTATGKVGIVSYDVDWVYGQQDGGATGALGGAATPIKQKGWALDGAVHFPVGPVTVNFAGTYATGDKNDGGDVETFPGIAPSYNGPGNGAEVFWSGGTFDVRDFQDSPQNTWSLGGWLSYNPVKALTLRGHYFFIGFSRKAGNSCLEQTTAASCPASGAIGPGYGRLAGKSTIGHEIGLRADYRLWTNFDIQGALGWVVPTTGDTAGEYILQLRYNF